VLGGVVVVGLVIANGVVVGVIGFTELIVAGVVVVVGFTKSIVIGVDVEIVTIGSLGDWF